MRSLRYMPHYTVAEYQLWEGEWELIDGLPYSMSPSPTIQHQDFNGELSLIIRSSLKAKGCTNCKQLSDVDWIINENTVLRPDIAIIFNNTDKYITKPPVLIVEILSPSTAIKDRNIKYEIYQEQQVEYYIIVDPSTQKFSIYVLVDGKYEEQNQLTSFHIYHDCNITIDLTKVFAAL